MEIVYLLIGLALGSLSTFLISKLSAKEKVVEKKIFSKANANIIGYIVDLINNILFFIYIDFNE